MPIRTKITKIFLQTIPVWIMIGLIPLIQNDYKLLFAQLCIMLISFIFTQKKFDYLFFIFGTIVMMVSEMIFISTGVETFTRKSLFGMMPIWLPTLWGYCFVVMRRAVKIIEN